MKNEITAPTNPEMESRPKLWIFQSYGATVKVREEVSWMEMFLSRANVSVLILGFEAGFQGGSLPAYEDAYCETDEYDGWVGE